MLKYFEINCKYQCIEKNQDHLQSSVSYRFKFSSIAHHYNNHLKVLISFGNQQKINGYEAKKIPTFLYHVLIY